MSIDAIKSFLRDEFRGDVTYQAAMCDHTWYRIGGPADALCAPEDEAALSELIKVCNEATIPWLILGDGANVLVADAGYRGVIISLKEYFNTGFVRGNKLFAQAGAYLNDVLLLARDNSLSGLEYLSGIPGTIGGALYMNAGIDQGTIGDVTHSVQVLQPDGGVCTIAASDIEFGYRHVPQLQDAIILGGTFALTPSSADAIQAVRSDLLQRRAARQPLECPSCGSVFKRPDGHFVGKMVQDLGLKGLQHGGAQISDKHAGFIVNTGDATAADVLWLIQHIEARVLEAYGVQLQREVKLVGFPSNML
jgi:UDP-N-acetylmuramate dehydrogenase